MLFNKISENTLINVSFNQPSPLFKNESKNRMKRKNVYWLSQLAGWALFAIVNIIIIVSFSIFNWQKLLILIYLCFAGISITHLFRNIIIQKGWLTLPLKKIIPRVLISSILIGTILFILWLSADLATGVFSWEKIRVGGILANIFQLSSLILLWALIYFSVHFFENYKKAEIESYIWEAAVKDFELKTLKSQLNPHFMFNALNSIRALVDEDPESAQTAVTKLSNILRYSLKIERHETVSLEEEMQTVSDYLALERIRFEERLNYKIEMDPQSAKIDVPPMMVQTLVENGIKHGISQMPEGGEIFINTKVIDSELHIKIENSGQIDVDAFKNSTGFGIGNTKHRLSLLYGEKAHFKIQNKSDNLVIAEIVIPTGGIRNESFINR